MLFGSIVIPPILTILNDAFGFQGAPGAGPNALAAPQAALISAIAQGVLGGNLDWNLIGLGALIGVGVIIVDEVLRATKRGSLPPLAVGMGIYLPMTPDAADPGRRVPRLDLRQVGGPGRAEPRVREAARSAHGHRPDRRRKPVRRGRSPASSARPTMTRRSRWSRNSRGACRSASSSSRGARMALRADQEEVGGVMRLALGAAILLAAPGCAAAEAPPRGRRPVRDQPDGDGRRAGAAAGRPLPLRLRLWRRVGSERGQVGRRRRHGAPHDRPDAAQVRMRPRLCVRLLRPHAADAARART